MRKILSLTALAIVFLLFNSVESYACSCALDIKKVSLRKKVKRSVNDAGAVFSGKVVSIESDSDLPNKRYASKVKIEVDSLWKGDLSETVIVQTGIGGGDCGFPFEVGESYLIYAYGSAKDNSLGTGICSRTQRLAQAAEDLKVLGKGKIIVNIERID